MYLTIFLWDDESGNSPFTTSGLFNDANIAEVLKLCLESFEMRMKNEVRMRIKRDSVVGELNQNLLVGIFFEIVGEELGVRCKNDA